MKISTTTRVCVVIVFLSLVAFWLTVGFGVYTNGQSFRRHYLTCDGKVLKTESTVDLYDRSPTFGLTGAGFKYVSWGDYEIKIVVNPAAKATVKSGGEVKPLDGADVTALFNVERSGQTVKIPKDDYNLATVVKTLYGDGAELARIDAKAPQYKMTVTTGDENKKSFNYYLNYTLEPTGITINPDGGIIAG